MNVLLSDCCLRRFKSSKRCSSSKINSLFRSLMKDVFEKRRVRFDDEVDRIARIIEKIHEFKGFIK